jgi:PKD repeat protein
LLILSVLALALILAFSASLNLARPPFVDVQTDGLTSWNPNVTCSADLVTVPDILGRSYPSQSLVGSRYQVNATAGGVPSKRALHPPCTLTNVTGKTVSTFVQVNRVYLYDYIFASGDCSKGFKAVNGGGPYPNGQTFCDNTGDIRAVGTTNGFIHVEFDQDWLAKGYCGATVPSCNNVTIAKNVSSGSISLDMQGFVFWDDNHWELHPLSAWRRTPPPPPPNAPPSADFSWSPTRGNTTTTFNFNATVSDDHDPPSSIQVRWDWNGDKTWDTPWSTTKTASHKFSVAGNYTVILEAMDTGGLTTNKSHVVAVAAPPPPPPPNAPPSADFSWSPTRGNTTTTFNFNATVSDDHDPPSSIQVRWDWNGDKTWDTPWSTTKTASHKFSVAGNYTVILEAMDTGGLTTNRSHVLSVTAPAPPPPPPPNTPPSADFSWSPTRGNTTTTFNFTASVSDDHDPPGSIQVRWDWNGDGTWDTPWSTTKTASHKFSVAGNYTVVLEAMDTGGLTTNRSHVVSVAAPPPPPPPNAPPTVDFSWTPTKGNTSTVFTFTATVSDDHDPPGSIQVRWDWNGDGTWDTAWSTTKTAQHQYGTPGNYTVVVAAMDTGGLTSTQSHVLTVTAPPPPPPPPPPPGDFTIGANPISLKIVIGSSGTSAITLKSLNGLSGTANLKASISSSDIIVVWPTASINPSSLTLPANGTASSTLTVSTTVLTTPATYTVTVTATVGSISHAVVVTVQVTLPPSNSSLGLVGSQPRMIRDSDL